MLFRSANTECTLTNPVDQAEHGLTYQAQDGQAENSNVDSVENWRRSNAKLKLENVPVLLRACDRDVMDISEKANILNNKYYYSRI